MPESWDEQGNPIKESWDEHGNPIGNQDQLTQKTQATAKAAGAPTQAPQPLAGNMSKKGLFGEDVSQAEENQIMKRANTLQNMPSNYSAPISNATSAIGLAELPVAIARGSEGAGNWLASKMREPATSAQSLKGIPGTPKNILPRSMQRWTIPDWLTEGITPAGEKGTLTNPGPFENLPKRAPVISDIDAVNRDVAARAGAPKSTSTTSYVRKPTWSNVPKSPAPAPTRAPVQMPSERPWDARAARVRANPRPAPEVPAEASQMPGTGTLKKSLDVNIMPEPREPLPNESPGSQWSVERKDVPDLQTRAARGEPNSANVLRQVTGKPMLFEPRGTGYPGPREKITINNEQSYPTPQLSSSRNEMIIFNKVRELEPNGAPVSSQTLRKLFPNMSKEDFDAAALKLRERGKVFLSPHMHPSSVKGEEINNLIKDPNGNDYHVAISLR
jgi:hypothetical protein